MQTNIFFVFRCPGDNSEDFEGDEISSLSAQGRTPAVRTSEFKVYPNPVKNVLNVDIGNTVTTTNYKIKIFNSIGVQIKEIEASSARPR